MLVFDHPQSQNNLKSTGKGKVCQCARELWQTFVPVFYFVNYDYTTLGLCERLE
jgi:hypothetical protein